MYPSSTSMVLGGVLLVAMVWGAATESFSTGDQQVQIDDLISSLTLDGDMGQPLIRKVRQAHEEKAATAEDLNLADDVSEDYPVIFNIILFLAITLILALIAISVALATMDPGRDSLIYRVTSAQRFKKEN